MINERNKPNRQKVESKSSDEYFSEGDLLLGVKFQVGQAYMNTTICYQLISTFKVSVGRGWGGSKQIASFVHKTEWPLSTLKGGSFW